MGGVAGCLGIDLGGTKVALRAEAPGLSPRDVDFRWPVGTDAAQDMDAVAAGVAGLRARWDVTVDAVGVAVPATVDAAGRVVAWPNRPGWTGLDLVAALRGMFPGAEVGHADDGDLAALAEADHLGCADLVYVGVGTGVGGGIVLDGRSLPGTAKGSCEIGHLVVDRGGPVCDCGRRGCVQAVASGRAVLRAASRLRGEQVSFDQLREAWLARAGWAVTAVTDGCAALAAAIVGVGELVHPGMAVVGGGFAAGLPGFVPAVAEQVAALARPGHPVAPVRAAEFGGLSSLRGAVLLARSLRGNRA
ncbi:ROK family protein [Kutzneria sp. NPDC051319]|uniref:ROK family protein n=1 Tax=Kutzneria sp. NPDC051319 TaxID=3155047 RepID=UPI003443E3A5